MNAEARDPAGGARDPAGGARDPEAAVRERLTEAGGPHPMPPEVVARLDGVLAELERGRSTDATASVTGASAAGGVVSLRSRRRWPRLLLAAAAVVVGGYTAGTLVTQGTLSGSEGGDALSAEPEAALDGAAGRGDLREDGDRAGGQSRPEEPAADPSESTALRGAPESSSDLLTGATGPVRLRSDALETGVLRALRVLDGEAATTTDRPGGTVLSARGCPPPPRPGVRSLQVRYDGEPAVLVAGPERRGEVAVTVYDCSGGELDSTRVTP